MSDVKLNPQITEVQIGIRNLRNIKIYPLALGDELKFTEKLSKAITDYFEKTKASEGLGEVAIVGFIVELIKSNFLDLLSLVVEEDNLKDLIKDISNYQAAGIAQVIYQKNFEDASKNAGSLSEMIKKLFLSERPSLLSLNDMDTDILSSLEPDSAKEESQEAS